MSASPVTSFKSRIVWKQIVSQTGLHSFRKLASLFSYEPSGTFI